jgi:hypothetical protein
LQQSCSQHQKYSLTLFADANLLLVPHGASAQNRHLRHGVLLKSLQGVAFGPKELPDEVKLEKRKKIIDYTCISRRKYEDFGVLDVTPCDSVKA